MAQTVFPDKRPRANLIKVSCELINGANRILREVQLSGDAVPEREHTSSPSTRSEMAPLLVPVNRGAAVKKKRRILKSMFRELLQQQQDDIPREVQPSGDAVPEREHTSSPSTRSGKAPVSVPYYALDVISESPEERNERCQNQEDQPSGDAVPEIEETPTSTRGIPINDKCQEMINMISKKNTWSLSVTASKSTCCIFKVPHTFVGNSYNPSVVSIGPYHHGKPHLMMIEEHKWRYLNYLLWRKPTKILQDYLVSIEPIEKYAREHYSEIIELESREFIEMMVLDGCFIIELFRKIKDPKLFEPNDPLATVGWVLPSLYRDFLLLENQIPFIILEKLFEISKMRSEEQSSLSLSLLAMQFFNEAFALRRSHDFICRFRDLKGWHLLDFVRSSFILEELKRPQSSDTPTHVMQSRSSFIPKEETPQSKGTPTHVMHSFSRLRRSGIKLNLVQEESFLVVKFNNGVIEMPRIRLDELMGSFLSNCVAFEQCHCDVSAHFSTYATFLECLVESAQDVGHLRHHNIMENNLGNDDEVACFINKMGKDVMIDRDCYLSKLFENVDEYYRCSWNRQWATFKHKYLDTPWSFISALAAFVLLSFTIAQTFYTIYAYENRNDGSPPIK